MKRNGFRVMFRLAGLVKPLAGYMVLAIAMGLAGHLCASFITVLGGYGVLQILQPGGLVGLGVIFAVLLALAAARGFLRYGEQACNHFIAFKLLALIRDQVFGALRRLCPAKLEGRDRGDLISVITSDIELLEVFYAHTISPICIAVLYCGVMVWFIGSFPYRGRGAVRFRAGQPAGAGGDSAVWTGRGADCTDECQDRQAVSPRVPYEMDRQYQYGRHQRADSAV